MGSVSLCGYKYELISIFWLCSHHSLVICLHFIVYHSEVGFILKFILKCSNDMTRLHQRKEDRGSRCHLFMSSEKASLTIRIYGLSYCACFSLLYCPHLDFFTVVWSWNSSYIQLSFFEQMLKCKLRQVCLNKKDKKF